MRRQTDRTVLLRSVQMASNKVLGEITKVLQSNKEIPLDQPFVIDIIGTYFLLIMLLNLCLILYIDFQLYKEYNRLMTEETVSDRINSNLLLIAPTIISVAKKRNLVAKEAQALLGLCKKTKNDEDDILNGGAHESELSSNEQIYLTISICRDFCFQPSLIFCVFIFTL